MNDPEKAQGLNMSKYQVLRTDGSSGPGQKHEFCDYYVLDLKHDAEYAKAALAAYADACEAEFPDLAKDIRDKWL